MTRTSNIKWVQNLLLSTLTSLRDRDRDLSDSVRQKPSFCPTCPTFCPTEIGRRYLYD